MSLRYRFGHCSARRQLSHFSFVESPYARRLRVEPLEDRRLLALFTVSSLADSGAGSLREAISLANADSLPDTIDFSVTGMITIASQLPVITEDLTITGPGQELLTIDADNGADNEFGTADGYRIFEVDDGDSSTDIEVTIAGLTLTGGDVNNADDKGGAVFSLEKLTIEDSLITGNFAAEDGGGIYVRARAGSTSYITGTTVSNNVSGDNGGAMQLRSVTHISYSTVADNTTRDSGGGIDVRDTTAIEHTIITGNRSERGGGLRVRSAGTVMIFDSTISGNHATTQAFHGGGGISTDGVTTVTRTILSGNTAANIGGALENAVDTLGTLTVVDSTITGNSAVSGGGISGRATITDSSIINNNASVSGGGVFTVYDTDLLTITGSTISGNMAGNSGGGISAEGIAEITSSVVSGNEAGFRGGGVLTSERLTVSGSTISGNTAVGRGGGIDVSNELEVTNTTISGNRTTGNSGRGGGVAATFGGTFINVTISGNSTAGAGANGGGVYGTGDLIFTQSTIVDNHVKAVEASGGGVWGTFATINVAGSIIAGNTAGGGNPDLNPGSSTLTVNYSLVGDNTDTSLVEAQIADANGNLIGSPTGGGVINPLLGPLADNGGPTLPDGAVTQTHALLPGSPALDAGDPNFDPNNFNPPLTEEQRGLARNVNGVDIGAYEAQVTPSADFTQDGAVDGRDFFRWLLNVGTTSGAVLADGNSDDDGDVDSSDLAAYEAAFGQVANQVAPAVGTAGLADLALAVALENQSVDGAAEVVIDSAVEEVFVDRTAIFAATTTTSATPSGEPGAPANGENRDASAPTISDKLLERVFA